MKKLLIILFCLLMASTSWATVSVTDRKVQYNCNGVLTSFIYAFQVYEDSDLVVKTSSALDEEGTTLTLNVDYSVTGAGDESGGTVVLSAGSKCASGETLTIYREIPLLQQLDFVDGEAFSAEDIEQGLDKAMLIAQDVNSKMDRAALLMENSDAGPISLPDPTSGKYLRWKSDETGLENVNIVTSGGPVLVNPTRLSYYGCNLATMVSQVGSVVDTHIIIDCKPDDLTSDLTIPENITIEWRSGYKLSGAFTLTINGTLIAGDYQLFSSDVTVVPNKAAVLFPEFWKENTTPGTTDMTVALQSAVDAAAYNNCNIVINNQLLITDQINLPLKSITISGIENGYTVLGVVAKYHILNGITSSSKSLFYGFNDERSTLSINNLNVDMQDNESSFYTNETEVGGNGSAMIHASRVTIDNCGLKGIVLEPGARASIIENVNISGISTASIVDGSGIAPGSIGLEINSADIKILSSEIKGKFNTGILISSAQNVIANNFIDQCNIGSTELGTDNKWVGNRFQYNYTKGLEIGSGSVQPLTGVIIGNVFSQNNSIRTAAPGSYDGIGVDMIRASNFCVIGNSFSNMLTGIRIQRGNNLFIQPNAYQTLDGDLYDYSANVGTDSLLLDLKKFDYIFGSTVYSGLEFGNTYIDITGSILPSRPSPVGTNIFTTLSSDESVSIRETNIIQAQPSSPGRTLTIDDTDDFRQKNTLLLIYNSGSQAFTLANSSGGGIVGTTNIVSGARYLYITSSGGKLVEF